MLITFSCKAHHDIVMFGEVGQALLKGMGMSGRVPGALGPEEIPAARASLETWLNSNPAPPADAEARRSAGEDEREPPVPLRRRALPLLEMLERAEAEDCPVIWE